MSTKRLTAWASALLVAGAMTVSAAGTASAEPAGAQRVASYMGVRLVDESDNGQCVGPRSGTWTPEETNKVRLDTDNRSGGCQLAFGIGDLDGSLAGLQMTYQLEPHPGSRAEQCGTNWNPNPIPIGRSFQFGSDVRVDSDNRAGWCDLTFATSGRYDVLLEVQFNADGDPDQCKNATPPGTWQLVPPGGSLTLGIDTDGRAGGCTLALRLLKL